NMFDGQRYMGDETHPDRSRTRIPQDVMRAELKKSDDWHDKPDEVVSFTNLTESEAGLVRFRYQFEFTRETSTHLRNTYDRDTFIGMRFTEGEGFRDGHLEVAVDLPESIAADLQGCIAQDPSNARTLVKQLLHSNNYGRVPQSKIDDNRYYPKYDKLPSDWTVTMITGNENARGIGKDYVAQ